MDGHVFDTLARLLPQARSRRALTGLFGGALAGSLSRETEARKDKKRKGKRRKKNKGGSQLCDCPAPVMPSQGTCAAEGQKSQSCCPGTFKDANGFCAPEPLRDCTSEAECCVCPPGGTNCCPFETPPPGVQACNTCGPGEPPFFCVQSGTNPTESTCVIISGCEPQRVFDCDDCAPDKACVNINACHPEEPPVLRCCVSPCP